MAGSAATGSAAEKSSSNIIKKLLQCLCVVPRGDKHEYKVTYKPLSRMAARSLMDQIFLLGRRSIPKTAKPENNISRCTTGSMASELIF